MPGAPEENASGPDGPGAFFCFKYRAGDGLAATPSELDLSEKKEILPGVFISAGWNIYYWLGGIFFILF